MDVIKWLIGVIWFAARGLWFVCDYLIRFIFRTGSTRQGALGTARFASPWQILGSGITRGRGPIVGRVGPKLLRFNKDGMITVFAPMGAGKGVGIVIPNLLSYPGSVLCTDIKGENSAITRRYRETFGPVHVLDATNPDRSDCFNPLDMIRVGTFHEKDDAEALAKLMIMPDSHENHWDAKAEGLLACLILHTLRLDSERRNLTQVRSFSTLPPESLKDLLQAIAKEGSKAASELANSFLAMESSEEFRSVYSNAEKATRVWSAGSPAGDVSAYSTFTLNELIERPTTIYVVVDEEKLSVYGGFLRVMVGCVINTMTRAKDMPRPKHKVLLLLDEAAALGSLEPLERGVGYLRAYCTPLLVFQDMSQLTALYRRSGSFLANTACKVFFNVSDLEAAKFVSETIGQSPALSRNEGTSQANTDLLRQQYSAGVSETARYLLDPSEVMRLPGNRSLILYRSDILRYPVLATKINYRALRHWYWWGTYDAWPSRSS
jgi:type IV secretion system protein VirD4